MRCVAGLAKRCSWTSGRTPNDLCPIFAFVDRDAAAEGILVGPVALRERLIDKRDSDTFRLIAGIEVAAAEQGNAEDLEIAGSNNVQFSDGLVRGVALLAFDEELVVESRRFVEREDARSRGGSDTGKGLDFLEERIEEAEGFLVAAVAPQIEAELNGGTVFWATAVLHP